VDQIAKPGERVEKGGVLCRLHASTPAQAGAGAARLKTAFEISSKRTKPAPLMGEVIA
jgi:thymidine phosphorylase